MVKLLREQMTGCLGKILKWHFPDEESGLGGTIETEVLMWVAAGSYCTEAILKSGGPKIKCDGSA